MQRWISACAPRRCPCRYAVRGTRITYRVWGGDDPMETDWTLLEDHWDDGVPAGGEVPLTAHTGGWQKIKVEFDARRSGRAAAEITAGTASDGISGVAAAAATIRRRISLWPAGCGFLGIP